MGSCKNKKAVALKYPKGADAPFITAIGQGAVAEKILEIANENEVAIIQNEPLTNFLSVQQIGSFVPESTFEVLAKIFAFVIQET